MRFWFWKNKWFRFLISGMLAVLAFFGVHRMITVEGAASGPQFVLLRLEDLGPGGQYATPEALGKLRAVLEMLNRKEVRYSLAVIPRWISLAPDGTRYDRSLDQAEDPYVRSFDLILRQAVDRGAALGMHGYTHQTGSIRREDGHQESGIGNEFDVAGMPETATSAFADERVKDGLRVFQHAGFVPRFWEAPHYHTSPSQEQAFRSYFGLIYQPYIAQSPNPAAAQYFTGLNAGFGPTTVGAVNVPTPFSYIPYNKDEKLILKQLGKSQRLASFFYHPFLEFKHLVPVLDSEGNSAMRDGLPEYKYAAENKSVLQKLIAGIQEKNYQFYSIHDYVPFTPAHRVELAQAKDRKVLVGDVTGKGQSSIVLWDRKSESVSVLEGNFKGMRNDSQPVSASWLSAPYADGAAIALNHSHGDGRQGLWMVQPDGTLGSYASDGARFILKQTWKIPAGRWADLVEMRQPNGDWVLAGQSQDHRRLYGVYVHNGEAKPVKALDFKSNSDKTLLVRDSRTDKRQSLFLEKSDTSTGTEIDFNAADMQWKTKKVQLNIPAETGEIRFGDFNGDGKEDILRGDLKNLTYKVYLQTQDNNYRLLSAFGPWGRANCSLTVADFDENGKKDIALIGSEDASMDIALSFESKGK